MVSLRVRRPARSCWSKLLAPVKLTVLQAVRSRQGADYLAGGLALGAFWLWTPIWLLHFPFAFATAQWARVSKIAAVSMVLLSNPVTVAPIQVVNLFVGRWMSPHGNPDSPLRNLRGILEDPLSLGQIGLHDYYLLASGSLVTGTICSLLVFVAARRWAHAMGQRRFRKVHHEEAP